MANHPNDIIQYNKEVVSGIFESKKNFHLKQARLSIEEKIKILVELQKIALTIRPKRGREDLRTVWHVV